MTDGLTGWDHPTGDENDDLRAGLRAALAFPAEDEPPAQWRVPEQGASTPAGAHLPDDLRQVVQALADRIDRQVPAAAGPVDLAPVLEATAAIDRALHEVSLAVARLADAVPPPGTLLERLQALHAGQAALDARLATIEQTLVAGQSRLDAPTAPPAAVAAGPEPEKPQRVIAW